MGAESRGGVRFYAHLGLAGALAGVTVGWARDGFWTLAAISAALALLFGLSSFALLPGWVCWLRYYWFAMRANRAMRAWQRFREKRDRWFRRATGGEP